MDFSFVFFKLVYLTEFILLFCLAQSVEDTDESSGV